MIFLLIILGAFFIPFEPAFGLVETVTHLQKDGQGNDVNFRDEVLFW